MARNNRHKGNRIDEPFVWVPYSVLNSPLFLALSPHAVKLLLDVAAQYKGNNNGDLCIAWKLMKPRGWRSEATLHKVKRELLDAGFLYETRKGQRPNLCSLFALTWPVFDDSDKYDPGAKAGFTRREYRFKAPLVVVKAPASGNGPTSPAVVAKASQRRAA
jgi:hypothetical protein